MRELAGDEAVLSNGGGNSHGLGRRSYLRAQLVRKLLAGIINDAKIFKPVFRVREHFAIECDVVQRIRVRRLNRARVAPGTPGGGQVRGEGYCERGHEQQEKEFSAHCCARLSVSLPVHEEETLAGHFALIEKRNYEQD